VPVRGQYQSVVSNGAAFRQRGKSRHSLMWKGCVGCAISRSRSSTVLQLWDETAETCAKTVCAIGRALQSVLTTDNSEREVLPSLEQNSLATVATIMK
jgi:hypothetical protein